MSAGFKETFPYSFNLSVQLNCCAAQGAGNDYSLFMHTGLASLLWAELCSSSLDLSKPLAPALLSSLQKGTKGKVPEALLRAGGSRLAAGSPVFGYVLPKESCG